MSVSWILQVKELLGPICDRENCRLYDVDSKLAGGKRILKVFIDADAGVNIDQCANVSNALSLILDVEDIVPGERYTLEVSSPGLERNLREDWHYELAKGKLIKVKLQKGYMPVQGPETKKALNSIKGVLQSSDGNKIVLEGDKERIYELDLADITQAQTVFEMNSGNKKKKN